MTKALFSIYADLEYLIEKIDAINSKNSFTTKVGKHIPSDFSMPTRSSFKSIENKHNIHRGKICVKNFFKYLREHEMKITNFKKKKMKSLTKEQQESYENAKICFIFNKKFVIIYER